MAAVCPCALALNPSLDISQYAHKSWTIRDGFLRGRIEAIAQTRDGYLWLGTELGLFRFDGVRPVEWTPPGGDRLPSNYVTQMLAARDGVLWIGTRAGLATWDGSKLTRRAEFDGEALGPLLEDREGTVWLGGGRLGAAGGGWLCAIRGGKTQCYGGDGSLGASVISLYEDREGRLWAGATNGLWRWKPGPPERYPTPAPIADLTQGDDGKLLVSTGSGIMQLVDGRVAPYRIAHAPTPHSGHFLRDRDGGLWITTLGQGLIHLHQGRTDVFSRADGLSADEAYRILEDPEGNIWVSTYEGLDRFQELPVVTVSAKQGLSNDAVLSVLAARDGSIWLAGAHGLDRLMDGRARTFRKSDGLPDDRTYSLFEDAGGRIWVSSAVGLAKSDGGRFVPVRDVPGGDVNMTGTGEDLWVAQHPRGLLHLRDGRVVEEFPWPRLGREITALALAADRSRGGVWLGLFRGDVVYFRDGQIRTSYTAAEGLGKGYVWDLQLDSDGTAWAATEGGLSMIRHGRIATLNGKNGLPCDDVFWKIEANDGSTWLYMACGLVRVARTEFGAWMADPNRSVQATVFDGADGVRLHAWPFGIYAPKVAKSADGKLWFVSGAGVSVIDPAHLPFNHLPPPVHIEQIIADDKPYPLKPGMRLPANIHSLRIEFTALSLVAPEKIHFKYKLEGQNRNWHEVINERQATYTNLGPKNYRFRVKACNNSGVWNETGDTLEFSIAPAYYQTYWFLALCVAAGLAMLWGLYRLRLYQMAREFAVQTEERTRIARELHDTMLQSFQAALIQMQAARTVLDRRPEKAAQSLDRALEMAAGAVNEGRGAIQDLRAEPASEGDLAQLLTAVGQELAHSGEASGNAPVFRVTVEGERQELEPLLQDEVYRIARELLRNAFQHAQADRIEAEIRYESRQLRVHVRDDGRGIDPEILKAGRRAGHHGLPGMRERADRFGGRLEFWSEAGAGTEAVLTVPGAAAYGSSNGGWFSFLSAKARGFSRRHKQREQAGS